MCGIVGYIGKKPAFPILLSGLKRVLYRGYDSFGFALVNNKNEIECFKKPGRLDEWETRLAEINFEGELGIAHCLTPDTLIQLANGRIVEISKIKEKEEIFSLNLKTQKLKKAKVKIVKHKSPPYLYCLRTPFSSLKCTGEHRMFVFSEGEIVEKRAKNINKVDRLIIPSKIEIKGKKLKFKETFTKRYYKVNQEISQLIKNKLEEKSLSIAVASTRIGVSRGYLDHFIRNDRNFREDELNKILPFFSVEFSPNCIPQNTIHGKFINLPKKSSPELMQIIGYLLGDGDVKERCIRFKDLDEDLLCFYKDLIEKVFNVKGRVVPQKGTRAYLLEVNSLFLCNWLRENIVLRKREFLEEIGQLTKKEIAAFLRGLFDAEGCVNLISGQVSLRLTDINIVKISQLLLLRFGIIPSFYKEDKNHENWNDCFGIYFSNYSSFKKFKNLIGFSSREKMDKIEHFIKKRAKKFLIKEIVNFNIVSQKILSIEKVKSNFNYLYDLEVNPYSNFFANGLLSHNSRWATTGEVNEANSHPHFDCAKNIFLVHNGIIENYAELKNKLIKEGHKFHSECDTEVLSHLIEHFFQGNLEQATRKALSLVEGTYALAIISEKDPKKLVLAKNSAPLLIGLGENEYIAASDPSAVITQTKKVIYLDDGEIAVLTPGGFLITDLAENKKEKPIEEIEWNLAEAQKAGYPHFMLKEIMEQPESINNSLRGRLIVESGLAKLGGLESVANKLKEIERLNIVACGTAFHAGLVGEYMLEEYAGLPCEVDFASEFRYRKPILDKKTATIFISQSGETADTISALKEIKRKGGLTLGIVNVVGSSVARESDAGVYNHIGPEIGVASTKAFTSQLAILSLFTLFLGRQREMSLVLGQRIARELKEIPEKIKKILVRSPEIKKLAEKYKNFNNFLFLGRKYNYPIALEGALKLKEISYIHAEGYGAGEMKHGPIALIDENFPTIAICPSDSVYEKMISNIQEIKARKGKVIAVATEGNDDIKKLADDVIYIPKTLEMLTPILSVIPLQLFAYYIGVLNGKDPDYPRNLAKSCTVE